MAPTILFLSLFLLILGSAEAQGQGRAPAPASDDCNGVFISYTYETGKIVPPILKSNPDRQSYRFEASLFVLNNGLDELKSWRVFVGFQHSEYLVSVSNAVLADGGSIPGSAGNGSVFSGFPSSDLKTGIETAGDLTQMSVRVGLVGTQFGVGLPNVPMPGNVTLVNDGWICLKQSNQELSEGIPPSSSMTKQETSLLSITTHKLSDHNYLQWSSSVLMFIRGKGKEDHLLPSGTSKPDHDATQQKVWRADDSMIMAWLINSMTPEISENFLLFQTASEIWEAVRETFSCKENTAELFEIEGFLQAMTQGDSTVTAYFTHLSRYWQKIDLLESHSWNCPTDGENYRKIVETKRVFKFLLGLDKALDEVRGRILSTKPLPTLREAVSEVRREESRRKVMLGTPPPTNTLDSSALASHQLPDGKTQRGRPWCDHCRRPGHTKETCWKLHGKPSNWKPRGPADSRAHSATSSAFNSDQLQILHSLINQVQDASRTSPPSTVSSGQVTHQGNMTTALHTQASTSWIVDSGASDHMTGNLSLFTSYKQCSRDIYVSIADGSRSRVVGIGSVHVTPHITLASVFFVPQLDCNLLSVRKLNQDQNCFTKFTSNMCVFQDLSSGKTIGSAKLCAGLYLLCPPSQPLLPLHSLGFVVNKNVDIMSLHYRLGHPNFLYLKRMFPSLFINKDPKSFTCDACQLSKHTRSTYVPRSYKPTKPFSMIHSDIWGASPVKNVSGARWFLLFVDDHTRLSWVFLMKHKSEASQLFINFHHMIQNQFNAQLQVFHSDNAREYFNSILGPYFLSHGIVHTSSCVDTPQQNGIAERKNRHLLEVARALMFTTNVPKHFWGEAVLTATYLINRMPSRTLNFQTPCHTLLQIYPTTHLLHHLDQKIFGCTAFVHRYHQSKLDPKSLKCIFVGYSPLKKGYKCYSPTLQKFFHSMDVTFHESQQFFPTSEGETSSSPFSHPWDFVTSVHSQPSSPNHVQPPPSPFPCDPNSAPATPGPIPLTTSDALSQPDPVVSPNEVSESNTQGNSSAPSFSDLDMPIALRKQPRASTPYTMDDFIYYGNLSTNFRAFVSKIDQIKVPNTVHEALHDPAWCEATHTEFQALVHNGTWEITDLPPGKRTVGCRWLFSVKYHADGSVERLKARLVAKGYTQSYGIDYHETFAPVAKLNTIRILLSLAVNLDWPLLQLDVKNAFLNGELEEEVYMDIPEGFRDSTTQNKVCKLKRSLYGLKQSPRAWFDRFSRVLKAHHYTQCQSDHTLFVKHAQDGKCSILSVYVDDIVITGDDAAAIGHLKEFLSTEFEIKDLGTMKYFLGMEIGRATDQICVSQRKYVLDLLHDTGMTGCKPVETPMDPNVKLTTRTNEAPTDRGCYQRLVGRLIYLSHTRPDIGFPVSVVSRFMHDPSTVHMDAVFRILCYLKGTPGLGLMFKKRPIRRVEIYTDADWASDPTDRRSTSGQCAFLWGNLVSWRSKKQAVVSRSSAEAEFRALALGICEGMWHQRVLEELRVGNHSPVQLLCDNKSALSIAKNPVQHDRTKHVEIDRHFISEKIENGTICLHYVPTRHQVADILTKALPRPTFQELCSKLDLQSIYRQA